jgi:hypothetical protein
MTFIGNNKMLYQIELYEIAIFVDQKWLTLAISSGSIQW